MNDEVDTNARVRTFLFLVIVFCIAVFVLSIFNQPSMKTTYLPVLVRPASSTQSQAAYPPPQARQAVETASLVDRGHLGDGLKLISAWRLGNITWQWI